MQFLNNLKIHISPKKGTKIVLISGECWTCVFQPAVGRVLLADCWAPPTAGSRGRPWGRPLPPPTAPPPPWLTRADPEDTAVMAAAERPAPPGPAQVRWLMFWCSLGPMTTSYKVDSWSFCWVNVMELFIPKLIQMWKEKKFSLFWKVCFIRQSDSSSL